MELTLEEIKSELDEIDQNIISSFTILGEPDLKEYPGCTKIAEIEIEVCGETAILSVGFPKNFPNELPKFYDKRNLFGSIPHKLSNGFLCFTRNESLIIDARYPASIVLNCLIKIVKLLEDGIKGINKKDFMDEFEVYWQRKSMLDIFAHIDTTNSIVRELDLWSTKAKNDDVIIVSAEKNHSLEKVISRFFHINVNEANNFRCIYIPLKEGTLLLPPLNDETWDFADWKKSVFFNLSEENKKEFNRLVNKPIKDIRSNLEFIIIGLPISNDNVALFGCGMNGNLFHLKSYKNNKYKKQIHPFIAKPKDATLYNASINRWHPDHLLNRTGGNTELKDKHILIAGVGSVGSEIAMRFAKAGVKKISLVDYDTLELENIHRHALGGDQVYNLGEKTAIYNKPKVWGIKEEINRKYPFTEVVTYYKNIFTVFDEVEFNKSSVDLIIIAIGSPNKEMMINERLHKLPNPPPTIYTWVEPLGIGGHALITLNNKREGCYQCLFKSDEDSLIYNRSAFAEPFQEFTKSITGCGSVFTPYNFLDSERSAMLTVETGIKVLTGNIKGNPLLSWKGDDYLFEKYGYRKTTRYSFTNERLNETKYLYKDDKCLICSEESSDMHQ
ncbi:ThiF family adenylyltransferase [Bacillus cereus]|uniref:ThiF family adenylyltransferase n=1 Tax=Bacillus cereus TaxID=1396 RepID=UPI0038790AD1